VEWECKPDATEEVQAHGKNLQWQQKKKIEIVAREKVQRGADWARATKRSYLFEYRDSKFETAKSVIHSDINVDSDDLKENV